MTLLILFFSVLCTTGFYRMEIGKLALYARL
jgi:hypothetical protein